MLALLLAVATLPDGLTADTTMVLPRGATVTISSFDRPVRLTGVAGDRVTVRGATAEFDGRTLEVDGGLPGRGTQGPVRVEVPTWATVRIESVSGEVSVEDAPATLEVEAVDGRIAIRGGGGELSVSGTAAIEVTDFAGARLAIEGLSGEIRVTNASGTVQVESVNGSLILDRVRSRDVEASTTNGRIAWTGDLDPAGRYRFETHNGDVEFRVPSRLNARLRIETFNGSFETRVPATTTGNAPRQAGPPRERRITATYGRGEATVEISSFNGSVLVRPVGET